MDRLRLVSVVALFGVALVAGGAVVRLAVAAGDLRTAATVGVLAVVLLAAAAWGARDRRWRRTPYW